MKIAITSEQKETARKLANDIVRDVKPGTEMVAYNGHLWTKAYHGFLGEIIYADYFELKRPEFLLGQKDAGYDFIHNGIKVDVKTVKWSAYGFPNLILFPDDLTKEAEAYFLIGVSQSIARLFGGISKENFKLFSKKKDFGYGDRFYVSARELSEEQGV